MTEVIASADGKTFTPVNGVDSSIDAKSTGDVIRAYFTGQKNNEYAFLITDVEDNEARVDVVAIIKPEQSFDIVNITSMAQTEVIFTKQQVGMDESVANEFAMANLSYISSNPGATISKVTAAEFLATMERTIDVKMTRDPKTDAVNVQVDAVYTTKNTNVDQSKRTITKTLARFSTNSTAEMARGVYVYYYPLLDNGNKTRDYFYVSNRNEISTPVYFIAMSSDTVLDFNNVNNYHPSLHVQEKSADKSQARTTVCSNVPNSLWKKTVYPNNININVKTLGNVKEQQTLYSVTIQVYRHRDESYNANGIFTPRSKDLLIETGGSFVDTSEKLDIETDKESGVTPNLSVISVGSADTQYTGNPIFGVYCSNNNAVFGN
jgi:hypothetical protein